MTHLGSAAVLICLAGVVRLLWLKQLPHEATRLKTAKMALADARPNEAIRLLRLPLAFAGKHYKLHRAVLLVTAYLREGQFIEAHAALAVMDEASLLRDEVILLRCAWSRLFLAANNPAEAARRLGDINNEECTHDTAALLVKGMIALNQQRLDEARDWLEQGLDRNPTGAERVLLLNNLALVERNQNRPLAQLERLQAARAAFQQRPRADLTECLHHNLSIALVRAGQAAEAREVLREAWAAGDNRNPRHVLEVLNNSLLAAREAGDDGWKREVYAEFDRQLSRLGPLSAREQFALDVSALRMHRNDGLPINAPSYEELIERLLQDLDQQGAAIPVMERVPALRAIRYDLEREIETRGASANLAPLIELTHRVTKRILAHREAVETVLYGLPPALLGPVATWRAYQLDMDKAEILLAERFADARASFARLFSHQREKAEWLSAQGMARVAIEAWIVLCDEFVAYHDQAPRADQATFARAYRPVAVQALDQASALLERHPQRRDHADHMIGIAYLHLRLRDDHAAAARWMSEVDALKPALEQYASWLRGQYGWVKERLSERPNIRGTPIRKVA